MEKILCIGEIAEQWRLDVGAKIVWIKDKVDLGEFVAANRLDEYRLLVCSVDELLNNGQVDLFSLREFKYTGQTQLIILNDSHVQPVKLDGIFFIEDPKELQMFLNMQGMLLNKKEELPPQNTNEQEPALSSNDECTVIKEPKKSLKKNNQDHIKRSEKKSLELPKIELPKIAVPKKQSATNDEVAILTGRQEIGFIGTLRGVGTTFAAFYYAVQCASSKQKISLVLSDEIEARVLQDVHKNIEVYPMAEMRSALANDIIVYDFGVLDRSDHLLIKDFERCSKRYIVASIAPHKKYGINTALQYADETTLNFTVLFNFVDDEQFKAIKKKFKGAFECDNLEYSTSL